MKHIRHGDVVIESINELPKNIKEIKTRPLAYGEVTGHSHRLTKVREELKMYEDENGRLYFKLDKPADLVHEEHDTIKVSPGIYTTRIIREYDYMSETINEVQD